MKQLLFCLCIITMLMSCATESPPVLSAPGVVKHAAEDRAWRVPIGKPYVVTLGTTQYTYIVKDVERHVELKAIEPVQHLQANVESNKGFYVIFIAVAIVFLITMMNRFRSKIYGYS